MATQLQYDPAPAKHANVHTCNDSREALVCRAHSRGAGGSTSPCPIFGRGGLRQLEARPDLPVVMLTGLNDLKPLSPV